MTRPTDAMPDILIIDDDTAAVRTLLEACARARIRGTLAGSSRLGRIEPAAYDMVFMAIGGSGAGLQHVEALKAVRPEIPVVAMLAQESASIAVAAVRAGCCDVIVKPLDKDLLKDSLAEFVRQTQNHSELSCGDSAAMCIVGRSESLCRTVDMARRCGGANVPVLIAGESGSGKELIASLVHASSRRSGGPFIRVNCAALSESLLESELFGHEKGAFTGAVARHIGRFERAHGGTLLLDEITETPLRFQAELLRVIEQQDFERVGGENSVSVDVRVISTTNRNILEEVRKGTFREDLYYRLSGVRLNVPPLRRRTEDIPDLVWHFIGMYSAETGRRIESIDPATMQIFQGCDWPGNVRQLSNVVRTALLFGSGAIFSVAQLDWLAEELAPVRSCPTGRTATLATLAGRPLGEIEQEAIIATLKQASGNQTRAARTLGISDRTLREKLKKYRSSGQLQLTA